VVVPAGLTRPTGGNRYDLALIRALRGLGTAVDVRQVAGDWPEAGGPARADLAAALRSGHLADPGGPGVPVLVDGLLACGAPEQIGAAVAAGGRVHVLVHMPLALDVGLPGEVAARRDALERAALRAATGVLATSDWAARDLACRHRLAGVVVARPGCDPAPIARGSNPARLLELAAVSPVKDQLGVVDALAQVRDLDWTARLTGDDRVAPDYTAAVRGAVRAHGLGDRVLITGPLTGEELDTAFDATDLMLLPSRTETWGLAVTEALARGIPAVVSAGTGAVEALAGGLPGDPADLPGAAVPAGNPRALAAAVRALLGPDSARARAAARRRRSSLPTWADTARTVRDALLGDVPVRDGAVGRGSVSRGSVSGALLGDAIPARPVDPGWLSLREGADARARERGSGELVRLLAEHLAGLGRGGDGGPPLRVVDLGSGTGANPRWLAARLGRPERQCWTTVDHDGGLAVHGTVPTTAVIADVADLADILSGLGPVDLVTAAALLDLLDRAQLSAVVAAIVAHRAAALFSLTVDGQVTIDPPDPQDRPLARAFDAHQRRGGRLGPDAGAAVADLFRARGWRVVQAPTPWQLGGIGAGDGGSGGTDAGLVAAWLAGRAEAAVEWEPQAAHRVSAWLQRRRQALASGGLRVVVGHLDVLALPPAEPGGAA
jgi:glycosyltransferase involved in cell wall biosynthesis